MQNRQERSNHPGDQPPPPRYNNQVPGLPARKLPWKPFAALGVILCSALFVLAVYVEDWARDLTNNHAATSDDHPEPLLRTRKLALPPAEVARLLTPVALELPGWTTEDPATEKYAEQRESPAAPVTADGSDAPAAGDVVLKFVRVTRIMKYRDDITVTISPTREGSSVSAESQSRVGKGDLGQNPRNLKELLRVLDVRVAALADQK